MTVGGLCTCFSLFSLLVTAILPAMCLAGLLHPPAPLGVSSLSLIHRLRVVKLLVQDHKPGQPRFLAS